MSGSSSAGLPNDGGQDQSGRADGTSTRDDEPITSQNTTGETCGCKEQKRRNIIVCIDGTTNMFGLELTNVLRLYKCIKKDNGDQIAFYHNGIPPRTSSWRLFDNLKQYFNSQVDLAIGWNVANTIQQAYIWLSNNYQSGDRIYLFGFSRGAHQVRVLAGIIATLGLAFPNNEAQVPIAYELYTSVHLNPSKPAEDGSDLATLFKETFAARDVRVHFLGVWDTMASVGLIQTSVSERRPHDPITNVCFFRHALALDEARVKFQPLYVNGGATSSPTPPVKEVWFPGNHGHMGGVGKPDSLTATPLRWMYDEAATAGLVLSPLNFEVDDLPPGNIRPRVQGLWWLLEFQPIQRLTYADATATTRAPHLGHGRVVLPGQEIHPSVERLDRNRSDVLRRQAQTGETRDNDEVVREP